MELRWHFSVWYLVPVVTRTSASWLWWTLAWKWGARGNP